MATSISSCPTEILQMITGAVDTEDLANLRLVSKQWYALSSRAFGFAKLRHPRFIISPYSLQALVDLTAHSILGPCVRSISIGTYRMKKHMVNTRPNCDATRTNVAALAQFSFEQTGHHLDLLTEAFTNLSRHGVAPMIGLFEDIISEAPGYQYYRRGFGYDELYGPIDIFRKGTSRAAQTLGALMEAVSNSGCPTNGLVVDLQWTSLAREAIARHSGLDIMIQTLAMTESGNLKSGMDLLIKLTSGSDEAGTHTLEIRDQGQTLLLSCVSVEDYDELILPQLDQQTYGSIANAVFNGQFHRMTLEFCEIDKSIFRLLRAQSGSLRHLSITSTTLFDDDGDDGLALLVFLKDELRLKSLKLCNLIHDYAPSLVPRDFPSLATAIGNGIDLQGSDRIITALDCLVKDMQALNTRTRPPVDNTEQFTEARAE